jgi:hypothetical protein
MGKWQCSKIPRPGDQTHPPRSSPPRRAPSPRLAQCLTWGLADTDTIDTYQPRHFEIGTLDPSEQRSQSHPSRPGDP